MGGNLANQVCPYCGLTLAEIITWYLNPENGHIEYLCRCGNYFDETEVGP